MTRAGVELPLSADEVGVVPVEEAELDGELAAVRDGALRATAAVTGTAAAATAALAVLDLRLALLPPAFVLGWLNLVGL